MREPDLTAASPADLRLLSPSALRLWRALVRHRDRHGMRGEWFPADLGALQRRAAIGSYRTAKAALAALRRAGLVATSRTQEVRWVRDRRSGELDTVNAYGGHLYLVPGSLRSRRGVDEVMVPARQWRRFVAVARRVARRAEATVEAWRLALPGATWRAEWLAEVTASASRRAGLPRRECTSVHSESNYKTDKAASEKAAVAALTISDAARIAGEDDDLLDVPEHGDMSPCYGWSPPLTPDPARPVRPPYLPPDRPARPAPVVRYVSPEQVDETKARQVVDGYRRAVRAVYGIDWWHYWKGDIRLSKHYAKLVAAGSAMADHSVPPEHWAIWRLRWFKEHVRAFASAPPMVWVACSAKAVSERAGWFRNEYDLPVPTYEVDEVIREQHLRNQEAAALWRGVRQVDALGPSVPRWYADKRRAEVASGITDPHTLWPTKPGSRYGRVGQ